MKWHHRCPKCGEWIADERKINLYDLKTKMGPEEDEVADKRFRKGVANINQYLTNMMDRRKHRLPEGHLDYEPKESEKES